MTSSEQFSRPVERGFVSSLAPFSHALVNLAVTVITVPNFLQNRFILSKICRLFIKILIIRNEKSFLKLEKLFVCSFFHKWAIYVNKKQNRKFSSLISISKFNHLKVPNSGVSGFLGAKSCCTAAVVLHQTEQRARCARWCSKKEN